MRVGSNFHCLLVFVVCERLSTQRLKQREGGEGDTGVYTIFDMMHVRKRIGWLTATSRANRLRKVTDHQY